MVREPRQPNECLALLRPDMPSVVAIKLGRDLVPELTLMERLAWLCPDAAVVLVSDVSDVVLQDLGYDVGASYVLMPPEPRDRLPEIVVSLMTRAIQRQLTTPTRVATTAPTAASKGPATEGNPRHA
jgi:DNA-binding NarL/FixJ family response regulator